MKLQEKMTKDILRFGSKVLGGVVSEKVPPQWGMAAALFLN